MSLSVFHSQLRKTVLSHEENVYFGSRQWCKSQLQLLIATWIWTNHVIFLIIAMTIVVTSIYWLLISLLNTMYSFYPLLLLLSHFSRVWLCVTPETAAHQVPHPWDSPGKNTAVGCHFLLQCMTVKSESEVDQSCPTLRDPMDCSTPGFPVLHYFPEFAQIHLHWVNDGIQRELASYKCFRTRWKCFGSVFRERKVMGVWDH